MDNIISFIVEIIFWYSDFWEFFRGFYCDGLYLKYIDIKINLQRGNIFCIKFIYCNKEKFFIIYYESLYFFYFDKMFEFSEIGEVL